MDRTPVNSSNIASIGYDPETATLEIEFLKDGGVYQYFDVPAQIHEELMGAASHGSYLAHRIKGAYQYARLQPVSGTERVPERSLPMPARAALREDWTAIGQRIDGPAAGEEEHFAACAVCGQAFDMRDLSAVAHHEIAGHERLPEARRLRLSRVSRELTRLLGPGLDRAGR